MSISLSIYNKKKGGLLDAIYVIDLTPLLQKNCDLAGVWDSILLPLFRFSYFKILYF